MCWFVYNWLVFSCSLTKQLSIFCSSWYFYQKSYSNHSYFSCSLIAFIKESLGKKKIKIACLYCTCNPSQDFFFSLLLQMRKTEKNRETNGFVGSSIWDTNVIFRLMVPLTRDVPIPGSFCRWERILIAARRIAPLPAPCRRPEMCREASRNGKYSAAVSLQITID